MIAANGYITHRPGNRLVDIVEAKLIDDNRLPAVKVGTMIRLDPGTVADWIRGRMTIAA